ncbi:collagen alpha-5(VI) chain-like [Argonauta hians]
MKFQYLVFLGLCAFFMPMALGEIKCHGRKTDIVFVLDSSASIWGPDFQKQLDFVSLVVDNFDVGLRQNQIRVGVMSFSQYTQFDILLKQSTSNEFIRNKLKMIKQQNGQQTNTDSALNRLPMMFSTGYGGRPDAQHLAILLTDGASYNSYATKVEAKKCHAANITLMTIGVGSRVNQQELMDIASEPKSRNVLFSASFSLLDRIKTDVIQRTCEKVTTTVPPKTTKSPIQGEEPECKNKIADIWFLLDSSMSVGKVNFDKQKNVIQNMISKLDIGPTKTRVAVATFSHLYVSIIKIGDNYDKQKLLQTVGAISYTGGATHTGSALKQVKNEMLSPSDWREKTDHILIVFTDGQSRDFNKVKQEASIMKDIGIRIFAIGIGQAIDSHELENMASKPTKSYVYNFASFDELLNKYGILTKVACKTTETLLPRDEPECQFAIATDIMFMISNNLFGRSKTEIILKSIEESMKKINIGRKFRFGTLYENCPAAQDIKVGSISQEEIIKKNANYMHGDFSSLFRKLSLQEFMRSSQVFVRRFGMVFVDRTVDLNGLRLTEDVQRLRDQGIHVFVIIIGDGVDETLAADKIKPVNIIRVPSYESLLSTLPAFISRTVCQKAEATTGRSVIS